MEGDKWSHESCPGTWTSDNTAKLGVGRIPLERAWPAATDDCTPSTKVPALHLFPLTLGLQVTQGTEALTREVRKELLACPAFHLLDSRAKGFRSYSLSSLCVEWFNHKIHLEGML